MKRVLIFILILVASTLSRAEAQVPAREKLDSYRIAFFSKKLNLTPREAEKFWPVYNEYQGRKLAIQQERLTMNRNFNQNETNMSEKEMTELADRIVALEVREANLAQDYHRKFKEILVPAKVMKLYQAENQYRLQLLNELKQNQQQRNNLKKGPDLNQL